MNETIAGRPAQADNPFESSARAMSEFVIRAAILPGTLFLSKPRDLAAGAASGDYRLLPSPYLLALVTGVIVSGVTSNLDKFRIPQPGQEAASAEPGFLKAVIDFYMNMDGVQAILFALPFIFVLWFLAAGLSLCMRRTLDETPTLFATLSWSLTTLVAITIIAAGASFLIRIDQEGVGAAIFFGSLAFALILAVKIVRTLLALRKQHGLPLIGAIVACIFAFAIVFFAGALGALMSGLVYSQRVMVQQIVAVEADGRRNEALNRGNDFMAERDYDSAIVEYGKAIEADPDYEPTFMRRASAYMQMGDYAAAIADYEIASQMSPNNPMYHEFRCRARTLVAQLDNALADCNRALELSPGTSPSLEARAMVYLRRGDFTNAAADFDAALAGQPDRLTSLYGRGVAQHSLGKARDGERDMAAAVARDPAVATKFKELGFDPRRVGVPVTTPPTP